MTSAALRHIQPFVVDTATTRSLHFSADDVQTRMRLAEPEALVLEYTRLMMGFLLFNSEPRQIGIVGLGGGSLAKFCLRYLPDAFVVAVEINPHVLALRSAFAVPPDGPRFAVMEGDGAEFVQASAARFDVLLVDGFVRSGTPSQLASQVFYDDCLAALQPEGILVVNLQAEHPSYPVHIERLRRSFGGVLLTVAGSDSANMVALACNGNRMGSMDTGSVTGAKKASGRRGNDPVYRTASYLPLPRNLPPAAMAQLSAVFARTLQTLNEERGLR